MSPVFSKQSKAQLDTCVNSLQVLFNEVVKFWDCTVLEGKRTMEQQRRNVEKGVSKILHSKHLANPSLAADVAPYPLQWPRKLPDEIAAQLTPELRAWMKDYARFYYFAGYVLGTADQMEIPIRHGGDWDTDRNIHEENFDDLVHFEVLGGV